MLALLLIPVLALAEPARTPAPLLKKLGDARVDWGKGLVFARAGAAADLRLPGPEAIRMAAVREATTRAKRTLEEALPRLPLGTGRRPNAAAVAAALERATVISADYQSSGGVILEVAARFEDLQVPRPSGPAKGKGKPPAAPEPEPGNITLSVSTMPLEAAPLLTVKGKEVPTSAAVYRLGAAPRSEKAVSARRDKRGRLVLPASAEPRVEKATRAVIHLRSAPRR